MARKTIAELEKEVEMWRDRVGDVKSELSCLRGDVQRAGEILNNAFRAPAPMIHDGFNMGSRDSKEESFSIVKVMGLAHKAQERIMGLEAHLNREREVTRDILDRFAPHKAKAIRTTQEEDPCVDPGRRY